MQGVVTQAYINEINNAQDELEEAMSPEEKKSSEEKKSCEPIVMLRLAYASQFAIIAANAHDHDDQAADPSQPKAPENKHLKNAIDICEKIKAKHPTITYPDLYQLAGFVAVKALEGPTIRFIPGRKESSISPDERCVPYDKKGPSELRALFKPTGFDDQDIVALCGGLKLARAHYETLVVEGTPQKFDKKFDNSYFQELRGKRSSSNEIDQALVDDKIFFSYVERYAEKQEDFFADYKKSHKKISEFKPSWVEQALHIPMAQKAVGVAVAAAVAILSFFYIFKRRRDSKHASKQHQ